MVYTEDGHYLVSAGRDNVLIVWSVRTYTKCVEFPVFEAIEGGYFLIAIRDRLFL